MSQKNTNPRSPNARPNPLPPNVKDPGGQFPPARRAGSPTTRATRRRSRSATAARPPLLLSGPKVERRAARSRRPGNRADLRARLTGQQCVSWRYRARLPMRAVWSEAT